MRFLVPILLLALAWSFASPAVAADEAEPPIALSLSLYIVDEAGASPTSELSSRRDAESVGQVLERMRAIWGEAGIELESRSIARITAPANALIDSRKGDATAFLNGLSDGSIEVPDFAAINGFYVGSLGRINGITPAGTRVFFVTDEPSVHDERVSGHEIGHILGLHHETSDDGRLMFSGTNGMALADEEIGTARYVAQGIIDGLH